MPLSGCRRRPPLHGAAAARPIGRAKGATRPPALCAWRAGRTGRASPWLSACIAGAWAALRAHGTSCASIVRCINMHCCGARQSSAICTSSRMPSRHTAAEVGGQGCNGQQCGDGRRWELRGALEGGRGPGTGDSRRRRRRARRGSRRAKRCSRGEAPARAASAPPTGLCFNPHARQWRRGPSRSSIDLRCERLQLGARAARARRPPGLTWALAEAFYYVLAATAEGGGGARRRRRAGGGGRGAGRARAGPGGWLRLPASRRAGRRACAIQCALALCRPPRVWGARPPGARRSSPMRAGRTPRRASLARASPTHWHSTVWPQGISTASLSSSRHTTQLRGDAALGGGAGERLDERRSPRHATPSLSPTPRSRANTRDGSPRFSDIIISRYVPTASRSGATHPVQTVDPQDAVLVPVAPRARARGGAARSETTRQRRPRRAARRPGAPAARKHAGQPCTPSTLGISIYRDT